MTFTATPSRNRRIWRHIAVISAASVMLLSRPLPVEAQQQRPPCAESEYRQLDFWVGEWDVEFTNEDGSIGRAENHITRDEYGACVISEYFRYPQGQPGGDFNGTSHSIYDRQTRTWRQMWVDNAGNVFDLRGGPVTGQRHLFELVNIEPREPGGVIKRMIWEDVTANSLVWRWQLQAADGTWQDVWVIRYHRRR